MRDWGINAVRIPFGYWIVEPDGPYVGGIERGERNVSLQNIARIAASLGAPMGDLLADVDRELAAPPAAGRP